MKTLEIERLNPTIDAIVRGIDVRLNPNSSAPISLLTVASDW
jgi:hypothetical protein